MIHDFSRIDSHPSIPDQAIGCCHACIIPSPKPCVSDRRYCGKRDTFLRLISTSQRTSVRVPVEGSVVLSKSVEIDTAVGVGRRMVGKGRETAGGSRVRRD